MNQSLEIEPTKASSFQSSEGLLQTVWGHVHQNQSPHAVYYVRWNETHLEEATFVVSVGDWSEGPDEGSRDCVAALARAFKGELSFMLVDAATTSFAEQKFLGNMRRADSVRETPLAQEVFHILDHVLVEDQRVAQLRKRIEAGA